MGASKEAKTSLFASWGLIVCVLGCWGRGRCPLHERLDCTHHEHAAPLSEPIKAHDRNDLISQATKPYRVLRGNLMMGFPGERRRGGQGWKISMWRICGGASKMWRCGLYYNGRPMSSWVWPRRQEASPAWWWKGSAIGGNDTGRAHSKKRLPQGSWVARQKHSYSYTTSREPTVAVKGNTAQIWSQDASVQIKLRRG